MDNKAKLEFAIEALQTLSDWVNYPVEIGDREYYISEILQILKGDLENEK